MRREKKLIESGGKLRTKNIGGISVVKRKKGGDTLHENKDQWKLQRKTKA